MVFIIHEKIYDTEKMEQLSRCDIQCGREYNTGTGAFESKIGRVSLYVSKKGNYLLECGGEAIAISKKEAKRFLQKYDYEVYKKLFGELEEA